MGLDMWLTKRKKPTTKDNLMYWCQANQIRGWFRDNVDGFNDNGTVVVPKEKLEELLNVCEEVLAVRTEENSKWLLPTTDGFIFGSTDYDEDYYDDVERTAEMLRNLIKDFDFDNYEVVYDEWY